MTQTERELQKLNQTNVLHEERIEDARSNVKELWQEAEKLRAYIDELRRENSDLRSQNSVQLARLEELQKRWDESDRRRWTVYGVVLAASLTFVANLVLLVLKR